MMYILQGREEGTGLQVGGMADASVFEPRSGGYDPHKTCSAAQQHKAQPRFLPSLQGSSLLSSSGVEAPATNQARIQLASGSHGPDRGMMALATGTHHMFQRWCWSRTGNQSPKRRCTSRYGTGGPAAVLEVPGLPLQESSLWFGFSLIKPGSQAKRSAQTETQHAHAAVCSLRCFPDPSCSARVA